MSDAPEQDEEETTLRVFGESREVFTKIWDNPEDAAHDTPEPLAAGVAELEGSR